MRGESDPQGDTAGLTCSKGNGWRWEEEGASEGQSLGKHMGMRGDGFQPSVWKNIRSPRTAPNTVGCGGSDPLVPGGRQHSGTWAEGWRWVLGIEEELSRGF